MFRIRMVMCVVVGLGAVLTSRAQDDKQVAAKARVVLEKYCSKCHYGDKSDGGFNSILDAKKLVAEKYIVPRNLGESYAYQRTKDGEMPPESIKERPSKADIEALEKWIQAGAEPFSAPTVTEKRELVSIKDNYKAIFGYLLPLHKETAKYKRFFTLTHLYNNPAITSSELRYYRAGLAKLINSLSWKRAIVQPVPVDKEGTVMVIDVRDMDWDLNDGWLKILGHTSDDLPKDQVYAGYPYALKHDRYPEDDELNKLAEKVYEMAGTYVPAVRADWFIATASIPPLYHDLLNIPTNAKDLEKRLQVDIGLNFRRDRLYRAGFSISGVSAQANRLVERHESAHGAYWKSYDFRSNDGTGNLYKFPLGPRNMFSKHPYPEQAFEHDGGEIIFSLPNGLQAYMLINGKDERINDGPPDVVRDPNETAGRSTLIVNGLSCMACHKNGMIYHPGFDSVRKGAGLQGDAMDKVKRLYPEKKEFEAMVKRDEIAFVESMKVVIEPHLIGKDGNRDDIKDITKPRKEHVSSLASPFLKGNVTVEEAARELGMEAAELKGVIKGNSRLRDDLGLKPWMYNDTIKREIWQSVRGLTSPYQQAANELGLGSPYRIRR